MLLIQIGRTLKWLGHPITLPSTLIKSGTNIPNKEKYLDIQGVKGTTEYLKSISNPMGYP